MSVRHIHYHLLLLGTQSGDMVVDMGDDREVSKLSIQADTFRLRLTMLSEDFDNVVGVKVFNVHFKSQELSNAQLHDKVPVLDIMILASLSKSHL